GKGGRFGCIKTGGDNRHPQESVGIPSQVSTTARDGPGKKNVRMAESESSKRVRREKDRYGAETDVDINSIDSIWSIPEDLCSAGRGTGETSATRPTPSWRSCPSQPPPRAPAPEDSGSEDMDTDLGSALSADQKIGTSYCVWHMETSYTTWFGH
ncbi:hypothetical protein ElyMa_002960500, partial [Elysia marginata]